jgi:hypothetical protein
MKVGLVHLSSACPFGRLAFVPRVYSFTAPVIEAT